MKKFWTIIIIILFASLTQMCTFRTRVTHVIYVTIIWWANFIVCFTCDAFAVTHVTYVTRFTHM